MSRTEIRLGDTVNRKCKEKSVETIGPNNNSQADSPYGKGVSALGGVPSLVTDCGTAEHHQKQTSTDMIPNVQLILSGIRSRKV